MDTKVNNKKISRTGKELVYRSLVAKASDGTDWDYNILLTKSGNFLMMDGSSLQYS